MDKKIRIRQNKREGKFTIDYARVQDRKAVRLDILKQINKSHELFIMINTAIDMYQSSQGAGPGLNLAMDEGYQEAEAFLRDSGYAYCLKKTKKEFGRTILGFSTGKTELRPVALLAVALGKSQLSRGFFNTLGCSHDLMIGIDPAKPARTLLDEFEGGKFDSTDPEGYFAFTMIDSQWLGYFYTDLDPSSLE